MKTFNPFRAIGRLLDRMSDRIVFEGAAKIEQDIEKKEAELMELRMQHARAVGFNIPRPPKGRTDH